MIRRWRQRTAGNAAVSKPALDTIPHPRYTTLELDPAGQADLALELLSLGIFACLEKLDNLDASPRCDVGQARDGTETG